MDDMAWSAPPAKPAYKQCGHRQVAWPHKACTRPAGHEGDHCEEKRGGTVMISTWWPKIELEVVDGGFKAE